MRRVCVRIGSGVSDQLSEGSVCAGQGCITRPWLFYLYRNGVVGEMKARGLIW